MQKKGKMKRALSVVMAGLLTAGCLFTAVQATEDPLETQHAHKSSEYKEIEVAPTCKKDGYIIWACYECDEYYTRETVPATDAHTEEVVPGKAATCTEPGLTDGKKCSVCGEILAEQEEIPASHSIYEEVTARKEATCGADGYKVMVCQNCEDYYKQEVIPATGLHTEEIIPGKAATCTEPGLTDGKK